MWWEPKTAATLAIRLLSYLGSSHTNVLNKCTNACCRM